jgi:Nickel responsive protein SCO4226-like
MPKFVIERELAGAGKLPKNELQAISQNPAACCKAWGRGFSGSRVSSQTTRSTVSILRADETTVREHAQKGGFPANNVARVLSVIDPTTVETDILGSSTDVRFTPQSGH